jgi:hypothetical protein
MGKHFAQGLRGNAKGLQLEEQRRSSESGLKLFWKFWGLI